MDVNTASIRKLASGTRVHRDVYTSQAVFDLESERVFETAWLYVAHESQLKKHGDFVRARMGRRDMIVTRGENGRFHVVSNRCAHRGAQLVVIDRGHANTFACPYHGWCFRPDGSLEVVPHPQSYPETFDYSDPVHRLARAPRVESYRGFIFASMKPSGRSLREELGSITSAFDNLVDRAPDGEIEIADVSFQTEYRANWKMHQENGSDIFHPGFVHESSVSAARRSQPGSSRLDDDLTREQLKSNDRRPADWESAVLVATPEGHSYRSGFYNSGVLAPGSENTIQGRYHAALVQSYGEERTREILGVNRFNNLVFPNILLNAQYHQLRVVHPVAPGKAIMSAYCFRLKGAPEEIYHRAVRYFTNLSSPASMISSDDIEIFERCQAGLERGDAEWVDFSRGSGNEKKDSDGTITANASELPMRSFHSTWLQYMTQGVG